MAWQTSNFQQSILIVLNHGVGEGSVCVCGGSIFQRGDGKKLNQTLVSRAADLAKHIISTSTNKGCPFGWQVSSGGERRV